ncbi:hypothetical protein TRFO_06468 [Tritrichomonas foetus]|uniref:Peptidase M60 domain-containing protein n=1 Tax=Tritrichomonas foetus TaxID=1144522 RepID=A0A1J4K089_9EUKA|nr:hypothetical protein TRFO_06468 [Tritrichomonas foetus]|eukprot:OHT04144.1 hypothetical protein TRFO_06468 [Tritrichomonas foetus]
MGCVSSNSVAVGPKKMSHRRNLNNPNGESDSQINDLTTSYFFPYGDKTKAFFTTNIFNIVFSSPNYIPLSYSGNGISDVYYITAALIPYGKGSVFVLPNLSTLISISDDYDYSDENNSLGFGEGINDTIGFYKRVFEIYSVKQIKLIGIKKNKVCDIINNYYEIEINQEEYDTIFLNSSAVLTDQEIDEIVEFVQEEGLLISFSDTYITLSVNKLLQKFNTGYGRSYYQYPQTCKFPSYSSDIDTLYSLSFYRYICEIIKSQSFKDINKGKLAFFIENINCLGYAYIFKEIAENVIDKFRDSPNQIEEKKLIRDICRAVRIPIPERYLAFPICKAFNNIDISENITFSLYSHQKTNYVNTYTYLPPNHVGIIKNSKYYNFKLVEKPIDSGEKIFSAYTIEHNLSPYIEIYSPYGCFLFVCKSPFVVRKTLGELELTGFIKCPVINLNEEKEQQSINNSKVPFLLLNFYFFDILCPRIWFDVLGEEQIRLIWSFIYQSISINMYILEKKKPKEILLFTQHPYNLVEARHLEYFLNDFDKPSLDILKGLNSLIQKVIIFENFHDEELKTQLDEVLSILTFDHLFENFNPYTLFYNKIDDQERWYNIRKVEKDLLFSMIEEIYRSDSLEDNSVKGRWNKLVK